MTFTPDQRPSRQAIALFGYYKYGNFGDDLMAVMIGTELQQRGVPFKVYALAADVAREFGFQGTASIDDLLRDVSAVVLGGGGVFLPPADFNAERREYDRDVSELCARCAVQRIPILIVSAGGAGQPPEALSPARLQLLKQARFISFRNPEDVALASAVSCDYRVHADMVWSAASTFQLRQREAGARPIIAVDRALLRRCTPALVVYALRLLCMVWGKPYSFTFYDQRHESVEAAARNTVQYSGVRLFLDQIVAASLVLTSRLHLGMVAMSCGIPAVQVIPTAKARILFQRLGLGSLTISDVPSLVRAFRAFLGREGLTGFVNALDQQDIEALAVSSRGHLDDLVARLG